MVYENLSRWSIDYGSMQRRQYLRAVGGCVGVLSLSGCAEPLPGGYQAPAYPGGTLVVETTGDNPVGDLGTHKIGSVRCLA